MTLLPHLERLQQEVGYLHTFFGYSWTVYEAVKAGTVDFGFVSLSERPQGVQTHCIREDPVAIVGLQSKFPEVANARSMEDLTHLPFVYHPKPQYNPTSAFEANRTCFIAEHFDPFRHFILSGKGIGPSQIEAFTADEQRLLAIAPFPPPNWRVNIYLIHRSDIDEDTKQHMRGLLEMITA